MHGAVRNKIQCGFGCLVESDACGSVCRELWCACGRGNVGMVICQSNVMSFLPFLGTFQIPSLHTF